MADRDTWVRAYEAAKRCFGPRARVRVSLLDPSVELAFVAVAIKLTTTGSGAEDVASAFGTSDVEALEALIEGFKVRAAAGGAAT